MFGNFKHKREFYVPKGARQFRDRNSSAVVYAYESEKPDGGKRYHLIAFHGRAQKPDFNYWYSSAEKRQAKAEGHFKAWQANEAQKRERAAKAKAGAAMHDVKVGDVFRCSWGYDQTNIDYYQCVKLIGKTMMEVRQIACEREALQCYDQYKVVPAQNVFIGKAERKKIQVWNGNPYFSAYSFASAYRMDPVAKIGNKAVYEASHETKYA